jgi:hypothetical protein
LNLESIPIRIKNSAFKLPTKVLDLNEYLLADGDNIQQREAQGGERLHSQHENNQGSSISSQERIAIVHWCW